MTENLIILNHYFNIKIYLEVNYLSSKVITHYKNCANLATCLLLTYWVVKHYWGVCIYCVTPCQADMRNLQNLLRKQLCSVC